MSVRHKEPTCYSTCWKVFRTADIQKSGKIKISKSAVYQS